MFLPQNTFCGYSATDWLCFNNYYCSKLDIPSKGIGEVISDNYSCFTAYLCKQKQLSKIPIRFDCSQHTWIVFYVATILKYSK